MVIRCDSIQDLAKWLRKQAEMQRAQMDFWKAGAKHHYAKGQSAAYEDLAKMIEEKQIIILTSSPERYVVNETK